MQKTCIMMVLYMYVGIMHKSASMDGWIYADMHESVYMSHRGGLRQCFYSVHALGIIHQ